jgi:flagellar biosynthesis/type III secretory pathway chaperone
MTDPVEALIETVLTLAGLVEAETENLLHCRAAEMAEQIAEKERAAQAYVQMVGALKPLKNTLQNSTAELCADLRKAMTKLDAALLRNGEILLHLQSRSKDLLETVAAAINPGSIPVSTYSATGAAHLYRSGSSIALNATY